MQKHKNILTLILIAILFLAPVLIASLAIHHKNLFKTKTYKGRLVTKETIIDLNNQNKWTLLFMYNQDCDLRCQQQILKLANMRLSLGRHLYQLNYIILLNEKHNPDLNWSTKLQGTDIKIEYSTLVEQNKIFLLNEKNLVILGYEPFTKPENIFFDLKKLLQ